MLNSSLCITYSFDNFGIEVKLHDKDFSCKDMMVTGNLSYTVHDRVVGILTLVETVRIIASPTAPQNITLQNFC